MQLRKSSTFNPDQGMKWHQNSITVPDSRLSLIVGYLANLLLHVLQLSPEARGQTTGCWALILQTLTYRIELLLQAGLLEPLGLFTLKQLSARQKTLSDTYLFQIVFFLFLVLLTTVKYSPGFITGAFFHSDMCNDSLWTLFLWCLHKLQRAPSQRQRRYYANQKKGHRYNRYVCTDEGNLTTWIWG